MPDEKDGGGSIFGPASGFRLKCKRCGNELPLLHPHIVVERYDESGEMICEWCWMQERAKK
jgi:uncharacterized Zn-finger protein